MSEFLMLRIFTDHLKSQGFDVKRRVELASGMVDFYATKGDHILLAEAKWIRSPGDIFEAVGRCVQNKLAVQEATPALVLPVGETTEPVRQRILGACYKYGIEIYHVDINAREVYPDFLTTRVFPALHAMIQVARKLQDAQVSQPVVDVLSALLKSLQIFEEPYELVDEINAILSKLK